MGKQYTNKDIYDQMIFRDQRGTGDTFEVSNITSEVCRLKSISGAYYFNEEYMLLSLCVYLSNGIYVEINPRINTYKIFN